MTHESDDSDPWNLPKVITLICLVLLSVLLCVLLAWEMIKLHRFNNAIERQWTELKAEQGRGTGK